MSKEGKHTPGPCSWNGNEIVRDVEPDKGIAGLAPNRPEKWGPLFAAAPEMLEALEAIPFIFNARNSEQAQAMRTIAAVIAKARGEA